MFGIFKRSSVDDAAEREKIARLEQAEADVRDLQERGNRAIRALEARHTRNHWGESIERMIQGAR